MDEESWAWYWLSKDSNETLHPIHPIEENGDSSKLKTWEKLCAPAIPSVIFGLLQLHRHVSRPLEEHVLDPKEITLNYDLFSSINSEDDDLAIILSQLRIDSAN